MKRITICPHFLFGYNTLPIETINEEIIAPLTILLNETIRNHIYVVLSKQLFENFSNEFPWSLMDDPLQRRMILEWNQLVLSKLSKIVLFEETIISNSVFKQSCNQISTTNDAIFQNFMLAFSSHDLPLGKSSEGIFLRRKCASVNSYNNCQKIFDPSHLVYVIFPWINYFDLRLPINGEYPFIPPENWQSSLTCLKGSNHGYIDDSGCEWIWDKLHNDHWDVQLTGGKYLRVSTDGRLL